MAPRASKQSDRNAAKKASKREDDEPPASEISSGSPLDAVKTMILNSCLAQIAPKMQPIVMELKDIAQNKGAPPQKAEEKAEEKTEEKENNENEGSEEKKENADSNMKDGPAGIFESMKKQLAWHNTLGLAASGEESKNRWVALKGLELDWGPRAKRKGNPGLDRIMTNVKGFLVQYFHALLVLMMLRAFLFRSYFACLPWLCGYQFGSLALPLENLEKLPQVPLEKIPIQARVVITVFFHALVWLFFLYEALWKTYFFEKFLLVGIISAHAYIVRPQDA